MFSKQIPNDDTEGLSSVPISTIGYEKRFNVAIDALSDSQKFIDYIKALKTVEIPGLP